MLCYLCTSKKGIVMNAKVKGTILGIVSAVSYGTNPLGALYLYREGLNSSSVLFYRFLFAIVILAGIMLVQRQSFALSRRELKTLFTLGILFAVSSLTFYTSFHYMDAGIAATILFVYPILVAVIMAIFFKEHISGVTLFSILLALSGIALLYRGEGGAALSTAGVLLVLASSLTYALYMVAINQSSIALSPIKLTFYVLLICMAFIALQAHIGGSAPLQPLTTPRMWFFSVMLALVPTVISLVTMTVAVHAIGSTPTAIMGALEPLTAVIVGVTVFGEAFTMRLGIGIFMILVAVLLIIASKSIPLHKVMTMIGHAFRAVPLHRR